MNESVLGDRIDGIINNTSIIWYKYEEIKKYIYSVL